MVKKRESVIDCAVIVLAAGCGKRMHSQLPKVLHTLAEKPLLYHVLRAVHAANPTATVGVVLGHAYQEIETYLKQEPFFQSMAITILRQSEPLGTGHAVQSALDSDWGRDCVQKSIPFLILPGDLPLVQPEILKKMMQPLESSVLRLLTCHMPDPTGYGRVFRGAVLQIVEEKDADAQVRQIQEVAVSTYFCEARFLKASCDRFIKHAGSGEIYLTQLVEMACEFQSQTEILTWPHHEDLLGVNHLWELAIAEEIMNQRRVRYWAIQGVRFCDVRSVRIGMDVVFAEEVQIGARVHLSGKTQLGRAVKVDAGVVLNNVEVGEGVHLKTGSILEQAQVGSQSEIGPYAVVRPGCVIGQRVRIGNFVELKNSHIGSSTKIAHLSYVGDASVGIGVNIGCGFVTCNFDGRCIQGQWKHRTEIGDHVFIGSDCQLVAPISIGDHAYIGSGSTITENVPSGALALARSRTILKPDYAARILTLSKQRNEQS